MATILYRVCDEFERTAVNVTDSWDGQEKTRSYTSNGCSVTESTRTLKFTASQAVDTAYRVYYQYEKSQSFNYGIPQVSTITGWVTMPANLTTVSVEVITFKETICQTVGGNPELVAPV